MAETSKIAVFRGGELQFLTTESHSSEVVLAMPLRRVITTIHFESREGANESPLSSLTPFPDTPLTEVREVLRAKDSSELVLLAAFPEETGDDVGEKLDGAKLTVSRLDLLTMGSLRALITRGEIPDDGQRRLLLMKEDEDRVLIVLDGHMPLAMRALSAQENFRRESLLVLLTAEGLSGAARVVEFLVMEGCTEQPPVAGVTVRHVMALTDGELAAALTARAADARAFDILPQGWRQMLIESRMRRKLARALGLAAFVWTLVMGVLFGVPFVYERLTNSRKAMMRAHARAYERVRDRKQQVEAVRNVSNHDTGSLEALRAVVSCLPEGIELSRWNFKRGDSLVFSATAADRNAVYTFKEALSDFKLGAITGDEDDLETPYFTRVDQRGSIIARQDRFAFELVCSFKEEAEE